MGNASVMVTMSGILGTMSGWVFAPCTPYEHTLIVIATPSRSSLPSPPMRPSCWPCAIRYNDPPHFHRCDRHPPACLIKYKHIPRTLSHLRPLFSLSLHWVEVGAQVG